MQLVAPCRRKSRSGGFRCVARGIEPSQPNVPSPEEPSPEVPTPEEPEPEVPSPEVPTPEEPEPEVPSPEAPAPEEEPEPEAEPEPQIQFLISEENTGNPYCGQNFESLDSGRNVNDLDRILSGRQVDWFKHPWHAQIAIGSSSGRIERSGYSHSQYFYMIPAV